MFWTRLASGVVLAGIALLTMGFGGVILAALLLVISLIAFRELTKVMNANVPKEEKWSAPEVVGMVGILAYYGAISFSNNTLWLLFCMVAVLLAELFFYVFAFPKYRTEQIATSVFSFLYAPVMLSFVYLTRESEKGFFMVWLILISAWGCDTCAYLVGRMIGKRKIFPVLSPKKSLEGCIGGTLGAALLGALYGGLYVQTVIPDRNIVWMVALICGVGAIMSMIGDLAASAIKRNHNIKDYGKLIPGHGGIMDRFDSMIVTAPMIYFLTFLLF